MPVVGVVLAGGAGSRMGGNKPSRLLAGKALIEHALDRLGPQVAATWISARGDLDQIAGHGLPIVRDRDPTSPGGALAGIVSALAEAGARGFDLVATVPCDAPFLP